MVFYYIWFLWSWIYTTHVIHEPQAAVFKQYDYKNANFCESQIKELIKSSCNNIILIALFSYLYTNDVFQEVFYALL